MKPTLLILAAGMGNRYGGLKQIDSVGPNGEVIIDYSIFDAIRAGFGKVVFVIRKDFEEAFKEKFRNKFERSIEVAYAFQDMNVQVKGLNDMPERQKPWGTAHAVLAAAEVIQEPFAVINADDYYGIEGFGTMADFLMNRCSPSLYSMMGYTLIKTLSEHGEVSRGACIADDRGRLVDIQERTGVHLSNGSVYYKDHDGSLHSLDPHSPVSMNFWGFHHSVFEEIRTRFEAFVRAHYQNPKSEFYIPTFISDMIGEGKIVVELLRSEAEWFGVTYKEDKESVQRAFEELVKKGVYPAQLWQG